MAVVDFGHPYARPSVTGGQQQAKFTKMPSFRREIGSRYRSWLVLVLFIPLSLPGALAEVSEGGSAAARTDSAVILDDPISFVPINYLSPNLNSSYESSTDFDAKGMQPLYDVVNLFIDLTFRDEPFPPDSPLLNLSRPVSSWTIQDAKDNWQNLAVYYIGLLVLLGIGILFCILIPCCGLIFCCCRCAGKCGAGRHYFEKKTDPCKRISYGILLSVLVVAIMFGIVCAFVTNEYLQHGVQDLPTQFESSLDDVSLYVANVKTEVNNVLVVNYEQLEVSITESLNTSGKTLVSALANVTQAVAIDELTKIVYHLIGLQDTLIEISDVTANLQKSALLLNNTLNEEKDKMISSLEQCTGNQYCQDVLNNYVQNLSALNFNELPNINNSIIELKYLLDNGNVIRNVSQGAAQLKKLQFEVQDGINKQMSVVENTIMQAGANLSSISQNVTDTLVLDKQRDSAQSLVDRLQSYVNNYSQYRYYVDMTTAALLLIIFICFVAGLFCGFCGKAPDSIYGNDCCSRGTGATMLMAAVYLIFFLSSILMVITMIHFLVGSTSDVVVCRQLKDPENSQMLDILDELLRKKFQKQTDHKIWNITLSDLISNCHQNESIYNVLKLENVYNLSSILDYRQQYDVEGELDRMMASINATFNVTLIDDTSIADLKKIARLDLHSIDFTQYAKILSEQITSVDLTQLAEALLETSKQISDEMVKEQLVSESKALIQIQLTEVNPLADMVQTLANLTIQLHNEMKFENKTTFNDTIYTLLNYTEYAQTYLSVDGPAIFQQLAMDFVNDTLDQIDGYINHSYNYIRNDLGRCGPISKAANATVLAVCDSILLPLNGYWISSGWCLILFIPCLMIAVSLASLYRKSEPYSSTVLDSDYLYDAYADRDNIPLANVHAKKGRRNGYERQSYENQSGYVGGGDFGPLPPSSLSSSPSPSPTLPLASRDTGSASIVRGGLRSVHMERYRDMAPKNWDSPHGMHPHYGPPLLSSAEYERPPPYYYPGPGELK